MTKKRLTLNNIRKTVQNQISPANNQMLVNNNETLQNDISEDDIHAVEELENGSTVYEIGKSNNIEKPKAAFHANLSLTIKKEALKKISEYLLECLDEDIAARQPWLDVHDKVKKYLGHNLEDLTDAPFTQASRTIDTTLSTALMRFCATTGSALLPESGPCGFKIFGQSNEELERVAKIRSQWLNYFLTVVDSAYYKDYLKSLYYIGFYGTIIKKIYYDSILKRPVSRFILPENFLINIDCTSILESDRLTHVLKLSARDILNNQKNNVYRDVELPYLKVSNSDNNSDDSSNSNNDKNSLSDKSSYKQRSLHDVYECHTYLNLEIFEEDYDSKEIKDISKPYIITIDKESKEIFSIKRNWKEEDKTFAKIKYFVAYQYFTGFDIWGLGLARIAGTNAIAVTNMLRQAVDAATYQNLPSGFIQKGTTKQQKTNITLGAGEWHMLDGTGSIKDLFAPFPANGPSPALIELRQGIIGQMQDQLSTTELGMMQSKEDIPTGTAIAFLEENNKIQSSVLKSLHSSFSEELKLLDDVFKEVIDKEEFIIDGENHIISKEHFVDSIQIVPVSDPSINSNIQRIMRAEAVFQTAMQMPEKVNMVELLKVIFQAQGLDDDVIENLIIKENETEIEPTDPISENMNMMQGKPVRAGLTQNHDAHIAVHSAVDNEASKAHIQEHMAFKFMIDIQNEMGIDLSQIDPNNPELQNEIAIKAAQAVDSLGLNKHIDDEDKQLDPNQLYAMDIEQKKEANQIKREVAEMKAESDGFKTQLHFEETKQKLKVEQDKLLLQAQLEMKKLKEKY
jgi:hypothetical protein